MNQDDCDSCIHVLDDCNDGVVGDDVDGDGDGKDWGLGDIDGDQDMAMILRD